MIRKKTYKKLHEKEFRQAQNSATNAKENREQKEAMYCFAKELNEAKKLESKYSHKMKKIKRRFRIESDDNVYLANIVRNGEIENIEDENLIFAYNLLNTRLERVYLLTNYHPSLRRDPNYRKFTKFTIANIKSLKSEIKSRRLT